MPDFAARGVRRDVVMLVVGALFGLAVGAGLAIALDDDETATTAATDQSENSPAGEDEQPTIDPTNTDFGTLTEKADEQGVKVQWTAEILEGPNKGTVDFITAHRQGTTVLVHEDTRLIDDGKTILVCKGGCRQVDAEAAREAVPALVRPFWDIIRLVEETTSAPDYRITGETQLESGIFERCGMFDPAKFGIAVPQNVNLVSQCVDPQRTVPIRLGLNSEQRAVGGASLTALADADAPLFKRQ